MHKTREDVELVITLGKPQKVIDLFLTDYLTGKALAPVLAAEEEYATLKATEDVEDTEAVLDEEGNVVTPAGSPNAERDARIAELEAAWPHLDDPEDGTTVEERRPPLEPELDEWKALAKLAIKTRFEAGLGVGQVLLSLGWPVDCRRSALHDDLGNMERLLGKLQRDGAADCLLKGADNEFHAVTLAQLHDVVIPEMVDYGFLLYQSKWTAEAMIDAAQSAEELGGVIY